MITRKPTGFMKSDCTCEYQVQSSANTLQEFIQDVLSTYPDEWGTFDIMPDTIETHPSTSSPLHQIKYKHGNLITRIPEKYKDKRIKGFRLFDKVLYKGQECFVFGRRVTGRMDARLLDGTHINASVGYKNLKLIEPRSNYLTERRVV